MLYLLCPTAYFPGNFFNTFSLLKLSPTKPNLFSEWYCLPSKETIPQPSCPLCCRACSPSAVKVAESGVLLIPNTPHSSFIFGL